MSTETASKQTAARAVDRSPPVAGRLIGQLERQGEYLFKRRDFFFVLLLPVIALAVYQRAQAHPGPERSLGWWSLCLAIAALGEAVRVATVGAVHPESSGRDRQFPRAPELNTHGTYSVVRHPLYLGNLLVLVGLVSAFRVPWLVLVSVLVFWLLFERVMLVEERFLENTFGDTFGRWAAVTPAFVPNPRRWRRSPRAFVWSSLWNREYNTIHGLVWAFAAIRAVNQVVVGRLPFGDWLRQDRALVWLLAVALPVFLVVRVVRPHYGARRRLP